MKKVPMAIVTLALFLIVAASSAPVRAGVDSAAAFERLKELAGIWKGTPEGEGEEAAAEAAAISEVVHEFEVSAGGTVVMETMGPGSEHEMINMYHLDGDDLVLTHYCSGGNQPQMRLDREVSSAESLVFSFAGGTNLEDADHYIHSAHLVLRKDGGLDSMWTSVSGGEKAGGMNFHLSRAESSD